VCWFRTASTGSPTIDGIVTQIGPEKNNPIKNSDDRKEIRESAGGHAKKAREKNDRILMAGK
jgi:hypothetical protein